jgi:predicted O-linked N-acetylglucosamine transferase (SPINDLY family)
MATISEALAIAVGHHQAGRVDAAEQIYRQILAAEPSHAEAWHLLGIASGQLGNHQAGIDCIRRALALRPDFFEAHYNLGNAFKDCNNLDEAVGCYRRALELRPDSAETHNNLGIAIKRQGKLDDAIACYRRVLQLQPDNAGALNNMAIALQDQGKLDAAVACYRRTLELKPDHAKAHSNLAAALQAQGKLDEAVACCRRALQLHPTLVEAHNNLGNVLREQGHWGDAVTCYRRATELKPDYAEAYSHLGAALRNQGKSDEAVVCYRRALELKPDSASTHSDLLLTLQYRVGTTLAELVAAHAEFDRRHAAALRSHWRPHENDRDPLRRLRVGFVSPDFNHHPVGHFLIRAMENLDREQCETVCYSDRKIKDELTARFQAAASIWRETAGWSDEQLAQRIRGDRVDILFDLAGHTAGNRLLAFARKPAPIQVTWAGYVGTTGLTAMDYLLADRCQVPADAAAHYCERVLRMPDGYVCFEPPADAPAVASLPAQQQGWTTFGCFNNAAKINAPVVAIWAEILRRRPQSRLVLKYRGMTDPSIADALAEQFAGQGIDPRRVECLDWSTHAEFLAQYGRIDLALDPFPYSGGFTTCEALWMGVPVVTCPGETFASRHSLSHLTNVGLTEMIARDLHQYVEIAVALAGDLPRLASLRGGLRERVAASPLCDGKRFATNLTAVLRDIWRQWVAQGSI